MSASQASAMDLLRQITVEVKAGSPLVLPSDIQAEEVDNVLLEKLFPNKRRAPSMNGPIVKKQKSNNGPIDTKLMATLGLPIPPKPAEIVIDDDGSSSASSASTPSPPTRFVTSGRHQIPYKKHEYRKDVTVGDVLSSLLAEPIDDLPTLQKRALEAQIKKDKIITEYYTLKLKKLEKQID